MSQEKKKHLQLRTGISKLFWCFPDGTCAEAGVRFAGSEDQQSLPGQSISLAESTPPEGQSVSWFDALFEGGIRLPGVDLKPGDGRNDATSPQRPLTFLLTGPPGSGKTTLATELAYRLTQNEQREEGLYTLYISTESTAQQIKANAASFGWEVRNRIVSFKDERPDDPAVVVWGTNQIKGHSPLADVIEHALGAFVKFFTGLNVAKFGVRRWLPSFLEGHLPRGPVKKVTPDIVVVDSLNILDPEQRSDFFRKFLRHVPNGPKIVIFVLESESSTTAHECWEYVCDNIVRLDHKYSLGYYLRTIQVVKARFQPHVWGQHLLKIYPPFQEYPIHSPDPVVRQNAIKQTRREYPYRKEGGIYIFPTINHFMSIYKRRGPTKKPRSLGTPIKSLNAVLGEGLPEGRCTAIIGNRGGHKSQFGYLYVLHRILKHDEKGLIISLRDDEGMTEQVIDNILDGQFAAHGQQYLQDLEKDDRIEVLYYPPGNITPEEFFHRIYSSMHRLKQDREAKLTVLFNSLDQLSARFPLCAKETIFVPGIVEALLGEGITSIFVAVEEEGQPPNQYGLLPLADVILTTKLEELTYEEYFRTLSEYWKEKDPQELKDAPDLQAIQNQLKGTMHQTVLLEVTRFAGGKQAGERGIWEAIEYEGCAPDSLYREAGLHFTPLTPSATQVEEKETASAPRPR